MDGYVWCFWQLCIFMVCLFVLGIFPLIYVTVNDKKKGGK